MSKSYFSLFFKGSAFSIIALGVTGILNYLIRRYLVFTLSEYEYGLFYSIFALVSLAGSFAEFGLTQAGTVMVSEASLQQEEHRQLSSIFSCLFSLKFITSLILFLILLIFNVPLREYCLKGVTFDIYFLGILLLLSQIFVTVFRALWNGTKHFLLFNLLIIVRVAFVYAAVLCLTKAFMIYGVLIAFVFAPFPAYLIAFYIARKLNGVSFYLNVNKSIWKKLLYLSGYVAIATTFMNLIYHLNTIMLTAMKGMEVSAQFNVALPIMQILQSAMVFPFIFLPLAVQMAKEMDYKSILFYRNLSTLLLLLVLPASYLIFWLISPWLITFLFADKYVGLANTVTLLCCGQILYTYGCFLMQIIIAMKGEKLIAILAVFCVILNVLLNLILIPVYSIPGTAMATLIAYFFFAGVSYFILSHLIKKHNQPVTAS